MNSLIEVSGSIDLINPVFVCGEIAINECLTVQGELLIGNGRIYPEYQGPYNITPTQNTQILNTNYKLAMDDIVINPIPSNYGLITWDGSTLKVS